MTGWRERKEEPVSSKLSRMFLNCSDEKYTPGYGVAPIIKYLPEGKIIWCPFDTCHSEFVLHLQEAGFQVKYSHINTGQDFFAYEPDCWDIIVSNPPFSRKIEVFERCLQLDKPFALLMSNFWLNSVGPCRLFKDRELQLLMFDKRIQYDKGGGVPFGSSYYCHRLLPKQIVFEELAVCRDDYSRMHRDVDNLNRNIAEEDTGLSLGVV